MSTEPQTLLDAINHLSDPDVALPTMVKLHWPNGVTCPEFGWARRSLRREARIWECKSSHVSKQFTAKRGTIFEDGPLSLGKNLVRPTRMHSNIGISSLIAADFRI